jgi:hypothetical protein
MALNEAVTFGLPDGYRVVSTARVEVTCARGCGWTLPAGTLSGMPGDVREQLFQYHDDWHAKQHRSIASRPCVHHA